MVKLKIAGAAAGKRFWSGSGMTSKTTNMNKLPETYGLQKLTQENPTEGLGSYEPIGNGEREHPLRR
jgi:hypothetical protein